VPAVLAVTPAAHPPDATLLEVGAAQVDRFREGGGRQLEWVVRARVPLRDEENCELVLFRDTAADREHLAIVVGRPPEGAAVPVRVHSACLTGDVLASLRCDCGDQLRGAVRRMSERGGGVLLYLDQEGRGIGLANKLRAYALQDAGLDTFDADERLGFGPDERSFTEAAAMLRALGIVRIRLLTNNPHKVDVLVSEGIEVEAREPILGARTAHNDRYLDAKVLRAGHLVDRADDDSTR
jgi:GTP cyclohydrolase II